jgi:hypothetical protein
MVSQYYHETLGAFIRTAALRAVSSHHSISVSDGFSEAVILIRSERKQTHLFCLFSFIKSPSLVNISYPYDTVVHVDFFKVDLDAEGCMTGFNQGDIPWDQPRILNEMRKNFTARSTKCSSRHRVRFPSRKKSVGDYQSVCWVRAWARRGYVFPARTCASSY